ADGHTLDFHDWNPELVPHNKEVIKTARQANLNIVPVFSNAQVSLTGAGEFDPKRAHALLTNPDYQMKVILGLRHWCGENRFQGINVDFENLALDDYKLLPSFLERMKQPFAPANLVVSADLESKKPLDWKRVAQICDFVVVMAYDEHSENSDPGPIASIAWYR